MAFVGGFITLLSDSKLENTVFESGEQAEFLKEINCTLNDIDLKLEKPDEGTKDIGNTILRKSWDVNRINYNNFSRVISTLSIVFYIIHCLSEAEDPFAAFDHHVLE